MTIVNTSPSDIDTTTTTTTITIDRKKIMSWPMLFAMPGENLPIANTVLPESTLAKVCTVLSYSNIVQSMIYMSYIVAGVVDDIYVIYIS